MYAVHDEAGRQTVLGKLIPDVVGMPSKLRMRPIAKMSRHGRARRHCVPDLLARGLCVADAHHNALAYDRLNVFVGARPFRRNRHQFHMPVAGIHPAAEFRDIRRPDAVPGMRSARPVLGRYVRALDVKPFHSPSLRYGGARFCQVSYGVFHALDRSGDHGGKQAGHTGGELGAQRARNILLRRSGRAIIHPGEAVYLQINPAGRKVSPRDGRRQQRIHGAD